MIKVNTVYSFNFRSENEQKDGHPAEMCVQCLHKSFSITSLSHCVQHCALLFVSKNLFDVSKIRAGNGMLNITHGVCVYTCISVRLLAFAQLRTVWMYIPIA